MLKFQASKDLILREIAGEAVLVPTGKMAQNLNGMIEINETFRFLWDAIKEPQTYEEILKKLEGTYEVTDEVKRDVQAFLQQSAQIGAVLVSGNEAETPHTEK